MFSQIFSSRSDPQPAHFLVVDVGTTGVKGIIFDNTGVVKARSYRLLAKRTGENGLVEQDPMEMLAATLFVIRSVLVVAKLKASDLKSFGLTNQRETTILWDKRTGLPVYPAIVWEDSRTESWCKNIEKKYGQEIREKTGLRAESYFSASKIRWILDNVATASQVAQKDALLFGTVDSWLLWNLTDEAVHATDYTNASRSLLFNIKTMAWDEDLLSYFGVPINILPAVRPSADRFGMLRGDILATSLPVRAVCGDQEASTVAAGVGRGVTKVTFGTGAFIVQGLGGDFHLHNDFYTTLVPGARGPEYVLESKVAGFGPQVSKYLNDPVKLQPVLQQLAEQTVAVLSKLPLPYEKIIIDGGISQSDYFVGQLERLTKVKIERQKIYDGTALGMWQLLQY